jgi:hypothetical protein
MWGWLLLSLMSFDIRLSNNHKMDAGGVPGWL